MRAGYEVIIDLLWQSYYTVVLLPISKAQMLVSTTKCRSTGSLIVSVLNNINLNCVVSKHKTLSHLNEMIGGQKCFWEEVAQSFIMFMMPLWPCIHRCAKVDFLFLSGCSFEHSCVCVLYTFDYLFPKIEQFQMWLCQACQGRNRLWSKQPSTSIIVLQQC